MFIIQRKWIKVNQYSCLHRTFLLDLPYISSSILEDLPLYGTYIDIMDLANEVGDALEGKFLLSKELYHM
jgi:hypothetical protein